MMNTESSISDNTIRFPSLESLRAAHTELLKRFRLDGSGSEMITEVETFIRRGKATGALLDMDADRWTAQSQLDYWATQLYKPSYEPPDATLDEFDPQIAPELDDVLCPYLGLDSFHETNQSVFFGRERLVRELVSKLKSARFLAVLGSSGSGKSSMVRAGLIPALKKSSDSNDTEWMYFAPMVPGSNPLANLVRLMMPDAGPLQAHAEVILLQHSPVRLSQLVSEKFGRNVVLVVDQFEEIFTLCTDEETRRSFVDSLIRLSQREDRQDRVIVTMRTDFESNIARLSNLQPLFEQAVVRITPLNAGELREAIEAPAAHIGLKFEEGVVDSLLSDTLGEPAALPLLQFTLLKLWENRERNRITWEAYRKLGGGRQALARSADEFYSRLIPEEQVTMRRILLKMVRPGEGLEVTSNRVPRVALYQRAEANDRIDRVLDKLIQSRLVRVSEGDVAADEQVEIAHEALVRNWPRLVEWLEEERVTLRQRQRLTTAAEEWQRLERDESLLWRGILLDEARHYDDLTQLETEFVAAGYEAEQAEAQRKLEEAQRQKELEYAKKLAETEKLRAEEQVRSAAGLRRRSFYLTIALGVALLAVVVAFVFNVQARTATALAQVNAQEAQANAEEAKQQAHLARVGELAAQAAVLRDTKLDLSLLLGVEVFRELDNTQTRGLLLDNAQADPHLLQFLRGHKRKVNIVAFSPDGKILASGSDDGTIILWDMSTRRPIGKPLLVGFDPVTSLAFSPDGKILASGRSGGSINLWDLGTFKPLPQLLHSHTDQVNSLVFSPNGRMLASASFDKTIILWDVETWKPIGKPLTGHQEWVTSVAFSPDGKVLASGGFDNVVRLWNVETQQPLGQPLRGHDDDIWSLAFSSDGKILASGGDNSIILWDMATGQQVGRLSDGFSGINSMAFSPDSKTLVSGYGDQSIRLWDVATQQMIGQPLHGHTDQVNSVVFSPDGQTLASGASDMTVILWNIKNRPLIGQPLRGHTDQVRSVAFSPNGDILASGSGDYSIILWNPALHQQVGQPLRGHEDWVNSVAFSPDGKILASGSSDRTVILWDLIKHQQIGLPLRGHTAPVQSLAFSPDGKILASGSEDETVILWDVATGRQMGQALRSGSNGGVWSVAFSPDGKILASGNVDSTIILWDVKHQKIIGQPLRGHTNQLRGVAFSPDGKTLVSGSLDQTVILWNVASQQMMGQPLHGHQNFIYGVAFSPDGKTVASASFDQTVILWDVATHQPVGQPLRGHSSVVWSVAFAPDSKTLASSSGDESIILWNLDMESWIELACQRAGRNLTRAEWTQYFSDEPYHATCPQWPLEPETTP
jgi:WD40 repeat protein